jgi:hypothetical protein
MACATGAGVKALFWLVVGAALGAAGYRYYEMNGGRLPIVEQLTGRRADDLVDEAAERARDLQRKGQDAVNEQVGNVTRSAVVAAAQEIAEAENAKAREQRRDG